MKTNYLNLLVAVIIPTLIASQMIELTIKTIPNSITKINLKSENKPSANINPETLRFLEEKNSSLINQKSEQKSNNNKSQDEAVEVTADINLATRQSEFNETISEEFNYTSHLWTVTAQIGEPNQAFDLELDTTISTTWVPSVNCKNCVSEKKYNSSLSRTARETNQTIKIEDYLGDLKGEVVYDDFHINSLGISLRNFPFIQAIELNKKKYLDLPEGKLALSNVNKYGEKFSILNLLLKSGKIAQKLFTLEFKGEAVDKAVKGEEGKIYFGELPEHIKKLKQEQQFGFCNSTSSGDLDDDFRDGWTCEMTHLFFNQKSQLVNLTDAFEIANTRVIFDSSYEFIGVSKNLYDLIYLNYFRPNFKGMCRKSEKKGELLFICNLDKQTLEQAESLYIVLQGFVLELTASDLFVKLDDNHNYLFAIKFFEQDDDNSKVLLLGHLFLKNFITIFDAEKDQVYFSSQKVYDISNDWNKWYKTDYYSLLLSRYFYLAIGACVIVALFLLFICFLVCRSFKRRNHGHGPLIENEIK